MIIEKVGFCTFFKMQIHEYINEIKIYQNSILEFIENDDSSDENFGNLTDIIENSNILINKRWLKLFLFLLLKIANNHKRGPHFFDKLSQIIIYLKYYILHFFTNLEIFNFFAENKRILLILIENNMITFNCSIAYFLAKNKNYTIYFFPEIRPFITSLNQTQMQTTKFEFLKKKREIGENDSYICSLIRNDSIEEFVSYSTRMNLPLSSRIKSSPFETNALLLKKEPTLIEYAAFFGSIQIFQFLRMNDVPLKKSLWKYAIHSNNAELIHLLEEHEVETSQKIYKKCYIESLKCHHNDIANYFDMNYIQYFENENHKKSFFKSLLNLFRTNSNKNLFIEEKMAYCNFALFNDDDVIDENYLFSICKYNYFDLAEFFIVNQGVNVNLMYI